LRKKKEEEKEHGRSVLQGEGKLTAVGAFEPSSSPHRILLGEKPVPKLPLPLDYD
jgi:hypothetical protein